MASSTRNWLIYIYMYALQFLIDKLSINQRNFFTDNFAKNSLAHRQIAFFLTIPLSSQLFWLGYPQKYADFQGKFPDKIIFVRKTSLTSCFIFLRTHFIFT